MELKEFLKMILTELGEQAGKVSGADPVRDLETLAEDCISRGRAYDLQEDPARAEKQYRLALEIRERLMQETGDPTDARDLCTSLADLCMQQGNMHGADFYYVKSLNF